MTYALWYSTNRNTNGEWENDSIGKKISAEMAEEEKSRRWRKKNRGMGKSLQPATKYFIRSSTISITNKPDLNSEKKKILKKKGLVQIH